MTAPTQPTVEEGDAATGTARTGPAAREESPAGSVQTFDEMLLATREFYRTSSKT